MSLLKLERITKLGRLGEDLVAERLEHHAYTNIANLNLRRHNYPFGDLLATKNGIQYFIGVKARNEMRQGNVGLNESYNLVLIPDALNKRLKDQGKTTDEITAMLLAEVSKLATDLDATPGLGYCFNPTKSGDIFGLFRPRRTPWKPAVGSHDFRRAHWNGLFLLTTHQRVK
jgi:hypothetical protein